MKKRPTTTSFVATRLVANALGVPLSPQLKSSLKKEGQKLQEAKSLNFTYVLEALKNSKEQEESLHKSIDDAFFS